jgi:hypothetical protein
MQPDSLVRVDAEYERGRRRLTVTLFLLTVSTPFLGLTASNEAFVFALFLPCAGLWVCLGVRQVLPRGSYWPLLIGPTCLCLISMKLGELGASFGAWGAAAAAGGALTLGLGFALGLSAHVRACRPQLVAGQGPSSTDLQVLAAILPFDLVAPSVVGNVTQLADADVNRSLDRLEIRGLVRRTGAPFVRRVRHLVSPTRAGRELSVVSAAATLGD